MSRSTTVRQLFSRLHAASRGMASTSYSSARPGEPLIAVEPPKQKLGVIEVQPFENLYLQRVSQTTN